MAAVLLIVVIIIIIVASVYMGTPSVGGQVDWLGDILGSLLQGYVILLSKPVTILCMFGFHACSCYTLIRLGIMMVFVYSYLSRCWNTALPLNNNNIMNKTNTPAKPNIRNSFYDSILLSFIFLKFFSKVNLSLK